MITLQKECLGMPTKAENEMKAWGRATYRKFQQFYKEAERGSELASSKRVLNKLAPELAPPIEDFFNRFKDDDSPSMPIWLCYIADFHPQMVAHIGLRTVLDVIHYTNTYTMMSLRVGRAFEEVARQQVAEQTIPKNKLYSVLEKKSTKAKMMRFYTVEKNNRRFTVWEKRHKIALGAWLLGMINTHTDLVDVRVERKGKKCLKVIHPSEQFSDWVRRFDAWKEVLDPMRMALAEKPKDWTTYFDGGYESFDDPFVMNRPSKAQYEYLNIQKVYQSINNIQRVPWQINNKVLEVAQKCWELDRVFDFTEIPLQPYLEDGDKKPEELKLWKYKQDKIRRMNDTRRSNRLFHAKIMHLGRKYSEMEEIYFPCRVDYRGRVYYMPAYLHPQSSDLARSLLLFKRGEQIMDEEDVERLLAHGANCWGIKGTLFKRVGWVGEHKHDILECADDPMTNDWWTEASEPFGFLAFCFEYEKYTREGYGYTSHFPVRMDCSNNGMQLLHLLLRDTTHANHCNLIPDQAPGDMYQYMADLVYERLKEKAKENYIAAEWLKYGVTRKLAKLAIMNKPYGQTFYHVLSAFIGHIGDNHPFEEGEQIDGINFLAEQFNIVAREELVEVARIQDFLKRCVSAVGNKPLQWSTPFGFKITQAHTKSKRMAVRTIIGEYEINIDYKNDSDEINPREQKKSITANFIHGLDASIVHQLAYGMEYDMGFVHDCFISHASNARKVHQDVRKTYKDFFSVDLLAEFRCELQNQNPTATLPDLPELGTLDVSQIDRAMYLLS